MEKKKAQELAENAGLTWLTTKDYGDELLRFAELVAANEREECAALCEKHYREPMILRATTIDEDPFRGAALDCAELIRMRSNAK